MCVCVCVPLCVYVAVKAGGMRIVQKHQPTAAPEPSQKDDNEEYVSSRYEGITEHVCWAQDKGPTGLGGPLASATN